MSTVHILTLGYDIRFYDADDGASYAGEGQKIVSVHTDREQAEAVAAEFNPVFALAEKEHTVFPIQPFNQRIQDRFGFTCHRFDDAYNFKLTVESFDVVP